MTSPIGTREAGLIGTPGVASRIGSRHGVIWPPMFDLTLSGCTPCPCTAEAANPPDDWIRYEFANVNRSYRNIPIYDLWPDTTYDGGEILWIARYVASFSPSGPDQISVKWFHYDDSNCTNLVGSNEWNIMYVEIKAYMFTGQFQDDGGIDYVAARGQIFGVAVGPRFVPVLTLDGTRDFVDRSELFRWNPFDGVNTFTFGNYNETLENTNLTCSPAVNNLSGGPSSLTGTVTVQPSEAV